jgi:hypothetical protein
MKKIKIYKFLSNTGYHEYLIKALSLHEAMTKFQKWQNKKIKNKNMRWLKNEIFNKLNWDESYAAHIIE